VNIKGKEKELTQYILEYGYLGYKHIELYGIDSKQKSESDMVKQTKYLNKYFPKTVGFIVLENAGARRRGGGRHDHGRCGVCPQSYRR